MISENRQRLTAASCKHRAWKISVRTTAGGSSSALRHRPLRVGARLLWPQPISGGPAKAHGWSPATISPAITFYYVAGAFLVMQVGDVIQKHGARPVVIVGAA
jgi:hypothetical protein